MLEVRIVYCVHVHIMLGCTYNYSNHRIFDLENTNSTIWPIGCVSLYDVLCAMCDMRSYRSKVGNGFLGIYVSITGHKYRFTLQRNEKIDKNLLLTQQTISKFNINNEPHLTAR